MPEDQETQLHYVNFPDPQLYLIGFNLSRTEHLLLSHQNQLAAKQTLPMDNPLLERRIESESLYE